MTTKNLDQNTFPLYAIHAINPNYFVCAGGGGAAKTGVNNAIKLYHLKRRGNTFEAECICDLDTERRAIMNLDLSPQRDVIAVGMDHFCQLYRIDYKKENDVEKVNLKALKKVVTVPEPKDEHDEDGEYQKCVRFTPDNQHLITGGSNGYCRVFKYPTLEQRFDIKAHTTELDEIDVHPNSKLFVSVSKDASAGLWGVNDGKKQLELSFAIDKKDDDFYRFRNCRFSENKDSKTIYLYTTHIPRKYSRTKADSCLVKWNTQKWIPERTEFIKTHIPSSLNVSKNGAFLGVGTAEGSILLYISWNMRHMRTIDNIHDSFITGLSFIPENRVLCEEMGHEAGVLTCSIDNNCTLSLFPMRTGISFHLFLFVFVCFMVIMFNIITYFDVEF
ncbi:guanine nucleotide-exchange factor SEC12-like [Clytia hemisphaerica]